MANNSEDLVSAVGLDLDSWDSGLRQMMADERKITRALDGVVDAANDTEAALNDIEGSIDLNVDTGDLEKAKNIAEDLNGIDPNVDISVSEEELETVRRLLEDIDGDAPTVDIIVEESELDAAKNEVNDIDSENPTVDVDVDKEEVDETQSLLEDIRNMQIIEIVMDVTGSAVDFITNTLQNVPGIQSIVALDDAMASFSARTGSSAFILEDLVDTLHGEGIVAGADEIGAVAETAAQLGVHFQDIDDAALATFNTIAVMGGDANETLTTLDNMVTTGLAPDFQTASDIIVAGLQDGANRGGDLLGVFNEYSATFAALGLDGEAALSIIETGLDNGFDSAQHIADGLRVFQNGINTLDFEQIDAATTAFESGQISADEYATALGPVGSALAELDLLPETEAFLNGEMSGEDYFNAVTTALGDVEDASTQAQTAIALFGSAAEDYGAEPITFLSTDNVDDIEGRAQEAADTMTDTISHSLAEVQQLIDDLARSFFSSDEIDIDGKLDEIKARIQTFIDAINSGATFGEALEIALDAPGLEDSINDLQAVVGNIALAIMQGMAGVLDFLGQGAAANSLRESVSDMAVGQLTFDIAVADNGQAVTEAVQRAVDRGVSQADIQTSLETAFEEALANGDVVAAQAIVDNISAANAEVAGMSAGDMMQSGEVPVTLTIDTEAYQAQIDQAVSTTQDAIDAALTAGDVEGATALATNIGSSLLDEFTRLVNEGNFDLAAIIAAGSPESNLDVSYAASQAGYSDEQIAELEANAQTAVDAVQNASTLTEVAAQETGAALDEGTGDVTTYSTETATAFDEAGLSVTGYADITEQGMTRVNVAIDAAQENIAEFVSDWGELAALDSVDLSVTGSVTGDSNGSAPGHWLGGVDSGTFIAGEDGREVVSSDTALAILNNQTTESLLSGLAMLFSGGFGAGGGGETTVTQNNYFNNNGAAASNASLDNAARGIRGF